MDPVHLAIDWLATPGNRLPVLLLATGLALLAFLWLRIYRYRHFVRHHRQQLRDKQTFPVGYCTETDLVGRRFGTMSAKRALLAINRMGFIEIFVLSPWKRHLHLCLRADRTELAYVHNEPLGSLLPSIIRLHENGRSHYCYGANRVTLRANGKTRSIHGQLAALVNQAGENTPDGFRHVRWLIGGILLLLMLATGLAVWSSWNPSLAHTPTILGRDTNDRVLVASRRTLYRFTADGTLLDSRPLAALGVHGGISDIQPSADGRILVGDSAAGLIKACDLDNNRCEPLPDSQGEDFLRSFQFAVDDRRARIYVADSSRHRLVELDSEGRFLGEIAGADLLCFPNDPTIIGDRLYLANTNHHRVLAWQLAEPGRFQPVMEMLTVKRGRDIIACPGVDELPGEELLAREGLRLRGQIPVPFSIARQGRVWPVALAAGRNNALWIINAGENMQHGDVLRFDTANPLDYPARVALSGEADPVALLARATDILIAETGHPSILRVSHDGTVLGTFGDAGFTAAMERQHAGMVRQAGLRRYAIPVAAGLLLLLGMTIVLGRNYRLRHIINTDPAYRR
ncbi:MAG: hypothetical protein PVJ66_07015 [Gammaproteobacteria bacterium]|jgi:hypothetical protein